jgi:DNA-binding CsgD family transcriptional regulator
VIAVVECLYALLCLALILQMKASGNEGPSDMIFASALGVLCLFLAGSGGSRVVWIVAFPPLAAFALGPRRGRFAILCLGLLYCGLAFFLPESGARLSYESMLYVVLAILSLYAARLAEAPRMGRPREDNPDAATQAGAESRARGVDGTLVTGCEPPAASASSAAPGGEAAVPGQAPAVSEEALAFAAELSAGTSEEILVLYRKDALGTLASVPEPEAVFSYILLQGSAAGDAGVAGGAVADGRASAAQARAIGAYELRGLGIDDLLDRVEAVIDIREARKAMEFNKIQNQIDMVVSRDSGEECTDARFERFCFEYSLSEREIAVAKCLLKGATNKEISSELVISVETVKTHVKNLLKKCDISSRIDFIKLFSNI